MSMLPVVIDTTKIQLSKQITTNETACYHTCYLYCKYNTL